MQVEGSIDRGAEAKRQEGRSKEAEEAEEAEENARATLSHGLAITGKDRHS